VSAAPRGAAYPGRPAIALPTHDRNSARPGSTSRLSPVGAGNKTVVISKDERRDVLR
jgi:hypothetical protein